MSKRSRDSASSSSAAASSAAASSAAASSAAASSAAASGPGVLATSDTAASGLSEIESHQFPWCVLCIIVEYLFVGHISAWIRTSKTMRQRLRTSNEECLTTTALYIRSNRYSCWDGTLLTIPPHERRDWQDSDRGECNYWSVPHKDMDDALANEYDKMFYKIAALGPKHWKRLPQHVTHLREFHFAELGEGEFVLGPGASSRGGESSSRFYYNKLVHLLATQCPQLNSLSLLNIPAWVYEPAEDEDGAEGRLWQLSTMDDRAMGYLGDYAHNLKHLMISVRNLPLPAIHPFADYEYEMPMSERRIGITPRGVEWLEDLDLETLVLDTAAWSLEGVEGMQWEPYAFDTLLATVYENFGGTLKRLRLPLERSMTGFETKSPVVFKHVTQLDTGTAMLPKALTLGKMFPNLTHLDMGYRIASADEREFHAVLDVLTYYPNMKRLSICNDPLNACRNSVHLIGTLCTKLTHVRIGRCRRRHIAALIKLCPCLRDINAVVPGRKQVFESRAEMDEWAEGVDTSTLGVE